MTAVKGNQTIEKQLFWTRLMMFGLSSVFLYSSGILVLSAFAPLTLAYLFLGQNVWLLLSTVCSLIVCGTSVLSGTFDYSVIVGYGFVVFLSFLISRFFLKGVSPTRMISSFSLMVFGLIAAGLLGGALYLDMGYTGMFDELSTKFIGTLQLDKLDATAKTAFESMPEVIFFGVKLKYLVPAIFWTAATLQLWIGLFFILRYSTLWRVLKGYKYSLADFVKYRNNDYIIFPFIILLAAFLFGYYQKIDSLLILSVNLLFMMSFFFFIHGFGVYMDFLKFVNIKGMFKSLFVVMGILFMNRLLVIIGIFDLWVNFRKFFEKKKES